MLGQDESSCDRLEHVESYCDRFGHARLCFVNYHYVVDPHTTASLL
jgi:hypothetical protein